MMAGLATWPSNSTEKCRKVAEARVEGWWFNTAPPRKAGGRRLEQGGMRRQAECGEGSPGNDRQGKMGCGWGQLGG